MYEIRTRGRFSMLWYIILAAAVILGIYLYLLYPGKIDPDTAEKLSGRAYAHRGLHSARNNVPENTLEAFEVAARHGYGIELDVRLSSDGEVIVFHDETLTRLVRIDRRVDELTAAQLTKMRVSGSEHFIPTFAQALDVIRGTVPLIVELKPGNDLNRLCEKTYALLANYQGAYCIESFDPRVLGWFRRHAKQVMRGQLATNLRDVKMSALKKFMLENLLFNFIGRPQFIAYDYEFFGNRNFKRCVTAFGALACAWTVTDQNTFDNLMKIAPMIIFERIFPARRYDNTVKLNKGRPVRRV